MIVRLQMDDALFDTFESHATVLSAHSRGKYASAEDLMVALLERFKSINPATRPLVVSDAVRTDLQRVLNHDISDENGLKVAIQGLASLEIGTIKIDLTPQQWSHLRNYANRNEIPLQSMLQDVGLRALKAIFEGGLAWAGAGRI